jgi:hypothetical protein
MPIAETPLEQLVFAEATYCTVGATVLLFVGADTVTPAKTGAARVAIEHTRSRGKLHFFIARLLQLLVIDGAARRSRLLP